MEKRTQFTLAYLFWEIFWIAVAMGATFQLWRIFQMDQAAFNQQWYLGVALFWGSTTFWGASIGGLFKNMRKGAVFGAMSGFIFLTSLLGGGF